MKKVNPRNYSLHLRHNEIEDHNEYWLVTKDVVHVLSICPNNHPSRSEHSLSYIEALKQYALMTLPIENWRVEDVRDEWHEFIENISV